MRYVWGNDIVWLRFVNEKCEGMWDVINWKYKKKKNKIKYKNKIKINKKKKVENVYLYYNHHHPISAYAIDTIGMDGWILTNVSPQLQNSTNETVYGKICKHNIYLFFYVCTFGLYFLCLFLFVCVLRIDTQNICLWYVSSCILHTSQ